MLANLKIIWQFHAHPVHQKVSRFFGPRYIGDDFFLGPNLVSFNRTVVPYEISKLTSAQKQKFLSVCQKRFNKLKNISISKQANKITLITHGFRISVVSDVRERLRDLGSPLRFMLRKLHQLSVLVSYTERVYNASNVFYPSVCAAMFVKKS